MNNFPTGYYYPRQGNSRIWVQGEAGAKSYLVAPNTSVDLWDSEKQLIYVKSADASGMPTMRTIEYSFQDNAQTPQFVTHDELESFRNYIEGKFNELGGDADDE